MVQEAKQEHFLLTKWCIISLFRSRYLFNALKRKKREKLKRTQVAVALEVITKCFRFNSRTRAGV